MRIAVLAICACAGLGSAAAAFAADPDPADPDKVAGHPDPAAPDKEVLEQSGEGRGDRPPEEKKAVIYTGIGASVVNTDYTNLSSAVNIDLAAGAHLPVLTWFSGEIDFSFTVAPGSNQGNGVTVTPGTPCVIPPSALDPNGTPDGCGVDTITAQPGASATTNDFQMTNIGAFAAFRTPGKLYVVGKYGYRYITTSIPEIEEGDDQAGTAWSYGGGYRFGPLTGLELGYTRYSSQMDYWGLNIAYGFGASPEPPR